MFSGEMSNGFSTSYIRSYLSLFELPLYYYCYYNRPILEGYISTHNTEIFIIRTQISKLIKQQVR